MSPRSRSAELSATLNRQRTITVAVGTTVAALVLTLCEASLRRERQHAHEESSTKSSSQRPRSGAGFSAAQIDRCRRRTPHTPQPLFVARDTPARFPGLGSKREEATALGPTELGYSRDPPGQEGHASVEPACVPDQASECTHDAVAGENDRHRVAVQCAPDSAGRPRPPDRCATTVRGCLRVWDRAARAHFL